jgi:HEAT repeat protein
MKHGIQNMIRGVEGLSMARLCLAFALLLVAKTAGAIQVPRGLDTCPTLSACLALLDKAVPVQDDGEGSNGNVLARDLRRFGEPAKQELLRRAIGTHQGWRNVAGAILADWGDWKSEDVPALRAALRMDHGGWVARPLGQIGTPDAIRALVEDLSTAADIESQTGFALNKLGSRAVPYLVPLLESQEKSLLAAQVIAEMNPLPISYASTWIPIALDANEPIEARAAALRGIAALGPAVEQSSEALHVLIEDSNQELRKQVGATLRAVHDPIVVEQMAKSCQPKASHFDFLALDSVLCLREIAAFGPAGRAAGESLMSFLTSTNGAEQAYGILTLGFIGYDPAVPKIEAALDAKDWRVVYAAIRASGWLGASGTAGKLDDLAARYWLVEVRGDAARAAAALRSPQGRIERGPWDVMENGEFRDPTWVITDGIRGRQQTCSGSLWEWQGEKFKLTPSREAEAHALNFGNGNMWGDLVGTDHGEWSGELTWIPKQGEPLVLVRDNVHGMDYDNDGAIALLGLAHLGFNYGYALKVSRNADASWTQTDIARLPGEPQGWIRLKADRIAVQSSGRVVVFSSKEGIVGVASCASQ